MKTLARPYARAAFAVAKESNALEAWQSFLSAAAESISEPQLAVYMENPSVTRAKKQALFQQILEESEARMDKQQQNFLALLLLNNRLQLLPAIFRFFREMALHSQNITEAHIRAAFALDAAEQQELEKLLAAMQGTSVQADVVMDKSLIGGLVIEMRGYSWDYSVKGRLEMLRKNL